MDTSVWIRFLANRASYATELDKLIGIDEMVGHEWVHGELLIGDRGGRRKLLAAYGWTHQASIVPHRDVVAFVRDRDLHGRGVGWIDVHLLGSAIVGRLRLWTADPRFAALAGELGVAYELLGFGSGRSDLNNRTIIPVDVEVARCRPVPHQ